MPTLCVIGLACGPVIFCLIIGWALCESGKAADELLDQEMAELRHRRQGCGDGGPQYRVERRAALALRLGSSDVTPLGATFRRRGCV
jgi:hypothetical protein